VSSTLLPKAAIEVSDWAASLNRSWAGLLARLFGPNAASGLTGPTLLVPAPLVCSRETRMSYQIRSAVELALLVTGQSVRPFRPGRSTIPFGSLVLGFFATRALQILARSRSASTCCLSERIR
jgi:hypothetical protein